jgi:hypothetical protein
VDNTNSQPAFVSCSVCSKGIYSGNCWHIDEKPICQACVKNVVYTAAKEEAHKKLKANVEEFQNLIQEICGNTTHQYTMAEILEAETK